MEVLSDYQHHRELILQKHQGKKLRKLAEKFFPARLILEFLIFVVQPTLLHEEKA